MKHTIIGVISILVLFGFLFYIAKPTQCRAGSQMCNVVVCFGDSGCPGDCICVKKSYEVEGFCWNPER